MKNEFRFAKVLASWTENPIERFEWIVMVDKEKKILSGSHPGTGWEIADDNRLHEYPLSLIVNDDGGHIRYDEKWGGAIFPSTISDRVIQKNAEFRLLVEGNWYAYKIDDVIFGEND